MVNMMVCIKCKLKVSFLSSCYSNYIFWTLFLQNYFRISQICFIQFYSSILNFASFILNLKYQEWFSLAFCVKCLIHSRDFIHSLRTTYTLNHNLLLSSRNVYNYNISLRSPVCRMENKKSTFIYISIHCLWFLKSTKFRFYFCEEADILMVALLPVPKQIIT